MIRTLICCQLSFAQIVQVVETVQIVEIVKTQAVSSQTRMTVPVFLLLGLEFLLLNPQSAIRNRPMPHALCPFNN
jgi:uncharacterized membrane protein